MLDQNVPNPLAKNPNFHTHKVFAAIGIILIVMVIIGGGIWYFVQSAEDKVGTIDENSTIKTATSSARTATSSAAKDETADWKIYTNSTYGFSIKYPSDYTIEESTQPFAVNFPGGSTEKIGVQSLYIKPSNYLTGGELFAVSVLKENIEDTLARDRKNFSIEKETEIKIEGADKSVKWVAGDMLVVDTQKGSYVYVLSDSGSKIEDFDTISSTFKFL